MQIAPVQNRNDMVSFESLIIEAKGKKALVNFVKGVSEDKEDQIKAQGLLTDFRDRLHGCDIMLWANKPQRTGRNLDVVLTDIANDETHWNTVPVLLIRQGKKNVCEPFYLTDLLPKDKTISNSLITSGDLKTKGLRLYSQEISERAKILDTKLTQWFQEACECIGKMTTPQTSKEIKQNRSATKIINSIFN